MESRGTELRGAASLGPDYWRALDAEALRGKFKRNLNEGLFSLIAFMGLDEAEIEAEGWLVRDGKGREFIDCLGGYGVFNFGHRHPEIIAAVEAQLHRQPLSSKLLMSPPALELAATLAEITPGKLQKCFFCNSGTEAVEASLKLARLTTGRKGIIYASRAFHGKTLGSLSATDREKHRAPFDPLLGKFTVVPFGEADALKSAVTDEVAAVILEPVQGEGGIFPAPPGYLAAARAACDRAGALLIFDEVQTGMGRTGTNFACEHDGVAPDVMALAKALGGGVMPIGAVIGTPEAWAGFEANPLIHTSTFGGNPLACAAALAACRVLVRDGLAERARLRGLEFLAGLESLKSDFPELVRDVRGRGLMIGIEFAAPDVAELFIAMMIELGVFVAFALNKPDIIRVEPPLTIPPEVVTEVVSRMRQACGHVAGIVRELG
ncbi:MAG: aspartate aminotransferase family protein [bacterium]|jgi:putrescine aminotransferase